ncbi:MAG: uracil-xanthine permease family protein [Eubacteriales bacterium]|nr:uracil-xanthine permease family protein [Eubacteriales bacterium]
MDKQNSNAQLGSEPIRDIRQLSKPKAFILGLQHLFAMFGATVLVPLITGLDISTTLLMAGLGTLLFHLLTRGKVPAFLGSSFAFLGGYAAVAPKLGEQANLDRLPYACGGVFIAGLVYVLIAGLIRYFGVEKVMRFFPPVVTGPIIISIGLTLAPSAIANANTDWLLALVAIAVVVYFNIFGKGMAKIIPIILGILVSYALALVLNRVDFAALAGSKVVQIPLKPDQFMKFDLSAIITIAPIALATIMEHIGDISAISATTGQNYIKDPGLHRTLLGDGLATSLASAFGGPANTTYGENTGVLVLTKVYDPRVMRLAALMAIALSFFPAVSGVIRSIPTAIIGGISMILYGMISSIGVRNLVENHVDFTKSRNLIVAASIFVCALGFSGEVSGISFSVGDATISLSGLAIAAMVGILLNAVLPGKDYVFTEEDPKHTGVNFSGTDTTKEGRAKKVKK